MLVIPEYFSYVYHCFLNERIVDTTSDFRNYFTCYIYVIYLKLFSNKQYIIKFYIPTATFVTANTLFIFWDQKQ